MYHYTVCGLDYVFLRDGFVQRKTPYGTGVSFHNADELDLAIAHFVIHSPMRLRGQEVRFLRSHFKASQKDLADTLGVKRVTVARWEGQPHTAIPGAPDRLLRILAAKVLFGIEGLESVFLSLPEIDSSITIEELQMAYVPAESNSELPGIIDHHREGWQAKAA